MKEKNISKINNRRKYQSAIDIKPSVNGVINISVSKKNQYRKYCVTSMREMCVKREMTDPVMPVFNVNMT